MPKSGRENENFGARNGGPLRFAALVKLRFVMTNRREAPLSSVSSRQHIWADDVPRDHTAKALEGYPVLRNPLCHGKSCSRAHGAHSPHNRILRLSETCNLSIAPGRCTGEFRSIAKGNNTGSSTCGNLDYPFTLRSLTRIMGKRAFDFQR
jgi:hypothetical protein